MKLNAYCGRLQISPTPPALPGGTWFVAMGLGDGLAYDLAPGELTSTAYLTFDLLVGGKFCAVFELQLIDDRGGQPFKLIFSALNQCSARLRLPLSATAQNAWLLAREAALLKPMCGGGMIDLSRVHRMTLRLHRHDGNPVEFCITPPAITATQPQKMVDPVLPAGKLLDRFGQSMIHDWPTKSRSESEIIGRLKQQLTDAPKQRWPAGFGRFGGWEDGPKQPATGFFQTHHDGRRWWLVDPDGCLFFSAGVDCVLPNIQATVEGIESAIDGVGDDPLLQPGKSINHFGANFARAFGDGWQDAWSTIALSELRQFGFNTVANWSDWKIAQAAKFPYVRPLSEWFPTTQKVFRDFPDVFADTFTRDCDAYAQQLVETRDDPAMIGYFLMNEPTWGFANQTPAHGMLINNDRSATRSALATFIRDKYGNEAAMQAAWGGEVRFETIEHATWRGEFTKPAIADLEAFSTAMVDRLMRGMSDACAKVDPHHLNLGARYYTVPPAWALRGMTCFDVFSINCYHQRVETWKLDAIAKEVDRPVMVGEWHFGALDAGLPASGIGRVATQTDRGRAFRVYTETAAALPRCVGVHYFTMNDQSAVGRYDGEHYNIGFLDVCNRPYEPLAEAARASHQRLYAVASGRESAFQDAPEYLPLLFI